MPNPHLIRSAKEALEVVKLEGLTLRYVRHQTPAICLAAVKQDGLALEYVRDQTPAICLAAVKQNGLALEYVRDDVLYDLLAKEV